ncbi:MAG: hypothetical protein FWG79_02355 [Bacteroidales bacterium]|nr:hypothetical protein [Bacteroidales bacterium]
MWAEKQKSHSSYVTNAQEKSRPLSERLNPQQLKQTCFVRAETATDIISPNDTAKLQFFLNPPNFGFSAIKILLI